MNQVESAVRERIRQSGRITFAEFMETALYGPGGFYASPGRAGSRGDYFTSPQAHPAFGAAVAVALYRYWRALASPVLLPVAELGTGDGLLAADVTSYARAIGGDFAASLSYSAYDRVHQPSAAFPVRSTEDLPEAPPEPPGAVISNELIDAFPFHRFVLQEGRVRELYVTLRHGRLTEEAGDPSAPEIEARVAPISGGLPDGFRGEVCLGHSQWAGQVSRLAGKGIVLTIDYGHERAGLYAPERRRGTMRCYYRHTLGANPFDHLGDQDITAHADFTAVDEALARYGFTSAGRRTQAEFLLDNGLRSFTARLRGACAGSASFAANSAGIAAITRPEGMGGFKVALHSRGVPQDVPGLMLKPLPEAEAASLPVPLLMRGDRHIRLAPEGGEIGGAMPDWASLLTTND